MSANLAGKVAVVTGASKGIGAAIARHLAAAGASVVVNYSTSHEGAEAVVAAIEQAGGTALAAQADVSQAGEIARLFDAAKQRFGRLDILVNNAGVYEHAELDEVTEEQFHKHFNLNVLGLILASQRAAEEFGSAGGTIINISSVAGIDPGANSMVYAATKAAVDAVTQSLAKALGDKQVRVNAINPGLVETEGTHRAGMIETESVAKTVEKTPLGRIGQPDDIAKVAVFLASEDSGWITGEIIKVAGGYPKN